MLTPSYSITATERVLPRLALDFTTGTLDTRVTVTRALNTATRINANGYIELVNADLPRFDYDPVSLSSKGLLIEELRSNLFFQSQAFTVSPWSNVGVGTVVDSSATGPDNTLSASVLTPTVGGGVSLNQAVTVTAVPHTMTAFAYPNGVTTISFSSRDNPNLGLASFDLTTGVATVLGGGTSASMVRAPNGYWRCAVTFTPTLGASNRYRITTATGSGTSSVYLYGAQLETGAFATSYIPTTTTSLTRNADVVSMTGTNFSDWYYASEGAFAAQYSRIAIKRFSRVFAASNVAESEQVTVGSGLQADGRENGDIKVAGVDAFLYPGNTPAANVVSRFCLSYKTGSSAASLNASAIASNAASFANPAPTQLNIGSIVSSGQYLNGHVQKLLYWPQDLTNAEVQTFAKVG